MTPSCRWSTFIVVLLLPNTALALAPRADVAEGGALDRRGAIVGATLAAAARVAPRPAAADDVAVLEAPAVEYLAAVLQYRGSLAANRALAAEPARWPALLARVDRFLGDPLSGALYFRGLCVQYCREIRYLDAMRDARRADVAARVGACDGVVDALRELRAALAAALGGGGASVGAAVDPAAAARVDAAARAAERQFALFVARAGARELREAEALLDAMARADVAPRDGRVEGDELARLTPEQAAAVRRMYAFY